MLLKKFVLAFEGLQIVPYIDFDLHDYAWSQLDRAHSTPSILFLMIFYDRLNSWTVVITEESTRIAETIAFGIQAAKPKEKERRSSSTFDSVRQPRWCLEAHRRRTTAVRAEWHSDASQNVGSCCLLTCLNSRQVRITLRCVCSPCCVLQAQRTQLSASTRER